MSTSALARKRGKKRPPTELLAAALVIYQNQELTRDELPGVMRRAAARMSLEHKLPEKLHFYTIYRWAKWGIEGGLTVADAGPLFQVIRDAPSPEATAHEAEGEERRANSEATGEKRIGVVKAIGAVGSWLGCRTLIKPNCIEGYLGGNETLDELVEHMRRLMSVWDLDELHFSKSSWKSLNRVARDPRWNPALQTPSPPGPSPRKQGEGMEEGGR